MSYSLSGSIAEQNARLLVDLFKQYRANELGAISGFFEVGPDWCCPVCHRTKSEIARLDKNDNLYCQLVWHHDHLSHLANEKIPEYRSDLNFKDGRPLDSLRANFCRFHDILICGDCNVVEGNIKAAIGAPTDFSFAPFELSTFIIPSPNRGHQFDAAKAAAAFEKIRPSLAIYGDVLRGMAKIDADPDGFEQIGGAAWRVLMEVNRKRKGQSE